MACPLCGDRCTCSYARTSGVDGSAPSSLTYEYDDEYQEREPLTANRHMTGTATPTEYEPEPRDRIFSENGSAPPEDLTLESARVAEPEEPGALWKEEVASRLESYRARRGSRRPRYNATMSLDFERATNRMIASALAEEEVANTTEIADYSSAVAEQTAAVEEESNQFFGAAVETPEPERWSMPQGLIDPAPTTKVIEFPRLPTLFDMAPTGHELAEPVVDKPRILDVPEEVPTWQAPLGRIQLDPEEERPLADVELPLCVAPMGRRAVAALMDAMIVMAGAAVFLAVVLREVPAPDSKLGYALVAALPAVLWAIYEYMFLVHCATTPGMQMAHLVLASFDSEPIMRQTRRTRALAWMLSTFPMGLGLVWALLDEDTLCWHDRITRTYLVVPEYEE